MSLEAQDDIFVDGICRPCPPVCDNVFSRVVVSMLTVGGTTVSWELSPMFADARPYVFTLQVSQANNPNADDWEDVGAPVTDIFTAVDGEQRTFSKFRTQFYRIKVETSAGTYYSDPTGVWGTLAPQDWRLARYALRAEMLYMRAGDGELGYILKRRIAGERCPHCLDSLTQEIRQPSCPVCFSTGFTCGYFFPIGCVWADISPRAYHVNIVPGRGTTADIVVKARMLNTMMLMEEDVFIHKATDDRYFVHSVQNLYEFRGVPVAAMVELRLAEHSNPIYSINVPDQLTPADRLMGMVV